MSIELGDSVFVASLHLGIPCFYVAWGSPCPCCILLGDSELSYFGVGWG